MPDRTPRKSRADDFPYSIGSSNNRACCADLRNKATPHKVHSLLVSLARVIFLIPYIHLQLTGLGIVVQVANFDSRRELKDQAQNLGVAIKKMGPSYSEPA
jgi:hypothetical protein